MIAIMDVDWFTSATGMFIGKDAEFSDIGRGPINAIQVQKVGQHFAIGVATAWSAKCEKDGWTVTSARGAKMALIDPLIELMNGASVRLSVPGCPMLGFVVIQFGYPNIIVQGRHASRM